jgi:hypothetical protein
MWTGLGGVQMNLNKQKVCLQYCSYYQWIGSAQAQGSASSGQRKLIADPSTTKFTLWLATGSLTMLLQYSASVPIFIPLLRWGKLQLMDCLVPMKGLEEEVSWKHYHHSDLVDYFKTLLLSRLGLSCSLINSWWLQVTNAGTRYNPGFALYIQLSALTGLSAFLNDSTTLFLMP